MDDGTFERLRDTLTRAYGKPFVDSLWQALYERADSPSGDRVLLVVSLERSAYEALRRDAELITTLAGAAAGVQVTPSRVGLILEDLATLHLKQKV